VSAPSRQAINSAKAVLAKCSANDPWFPQPSDALILAWAEHFQIRNYDLQDLLAAVTQVYASNKSGFKPLPGDILTAAAAIRNDRSMRESDEERERRQEEIDRRIELAELVAAQDFSLPKPKYERSRDGSPLSVRCDFCDQGPMSRCVYPGTFQKKPSFHPCRVEAAKKACGL
jgi:hypothetical protein